MKTKFDVGDEVVIKKRNEKTCDLGYKYHIGMESLAGNKATIESIRIDVDGAAYFLTGDENQWQGEWLKEAKNPCWDLSGLKVGDKVWSVKYGHDTVDKICSEGTNPIILRSCSTYTSSGHFCMGDANQSLFLRKPKLFKQLEKLK